MTKQIDYPYIAAWGRLMGSYEYYVTGQRDLARADRAPPRAIYKDNEGKWRVADEVASEVTRDLLDEYVQSRWPKHPALVKKSA